MRLKPPDLMIGNVGAVAGLGDFLVDDIVLVPIAFGQSVDTG